jgi:hypothetical protein
MTSESDKQKIRDVIKKEYIRCATDPVYFMKKHVYIQHPVKGRILLDLYDYQVNAIDNFRKHQYNIVLKGRQIGLSTVVAGYALWLMQFHDDKNILIIATKQETAKNIVTKVKYGFKNLPIWLQSRCVVDNQLSLKFANGSQIKAESSSENAGRSEALSLLIIDEAAFVEKAEEIWLSAQSTLSTGGSGILISTPNGMGNFFHRTWEESEAGLNTFNRIKLDYRVHPDRDAKWVETQKKNLGERGFRQEHMAEFLGSGNTVFDSFVVNEYYKDLMVRDPIEKVGFDKNLWIWEHPNYDTPYLVCADVARGDGADFSGFHVLDARDLKQVAEYKGKIDTTMFGNLLVEVATKYNDALLVVENSNNGWATIQQIINRNYKNLFYMTDDVRVIEPERHYTNKLNRQDRKSVPGFTTSMRTRPLIISKIEEYIRNKELKIYSIRMVNEMQVFIWENGKAQAQKGYNDDLIMSMAIGLWVRDTSMEIYQRNIELTKASLNSIKKAGEVDAFFTPSSHLPYDPYKTKTPNGEEDIRWLL